MYENAIWKLVFIAEGDGISLGPYDVGMYKSCLFSGFETEKPAGLGEIFSRTKKEHGKKPCSLQTVKKSLNSDVIAGQSS